MAHFSIRKIPTMSIDEEFEHYSTSMGYTLLNVGLDLNKILSSAQKEFLLWHWKLGISMQQVQELMHLVEVEEPTGAVSTLDLVIVPKTKAASTFPIPLCKSSQILHAQFHKPKIVKSKAISKVEGAISKEQYQMNDFMSTDQYVFLTPGRLEEGCGHEADSNMYHGGTFFMTLHPNISMSRTRFHLGAGETVQSKLKFKEWLWEQTTVSVEHYHSDNRVFTVGHFKESCAKERQMQSFCCVGAQHQNSKAEHAIHTVMYMALSFMIHATLNWGKDKSDDLSQFPFAVNHAVWFYNQISQHFIGITLIEMVTNIKSDHCNLMCTHVWDSQVYVLKAKLQGGKKLPTWKC